MREVIPIGGPGSGRYGVFGEKRKLTADESVSLDILDVYEDGKITQRGWSPETSFGLPRYYKNIRVSKQVDGQLHFVICVYDTQRPVSDIRTFDFQTGIEWTDCYFGGDRPWFICQCGRRVRKLFLPPDERVLLCSVCWNLGYLSSQRSRYTDFKMMNCARHLQNNSRSRGVPMDLWGEMPSKPKRMRWRTYRRLEFDHFRALLCATEAECLRLERMNRQTENLLKTIRRGHRIKSGIIS